jgi:2-polyprenyl-6-hydroxyphenyl methylase/3-demethylubiquinone-9 3-methyltransferase
MDESARDAGTVFAFGENWSRFLGTVDEAAIRRAEGSITGLLGVTDLAGQTFLDVGSGSGLQSLAARRLGATVRSFDSDRQSVACTEALKRRYFPDDSLWSVEHGSVLDRDYVRGLGRFDIVYAWGVLHHTGRMYEALDNVAAAVSPGGRLALAVYNDQGWISAYWARVKRIYNVNAATRAAVITIHAPYLFGLRWLIRTLLHRGALDRGMSPWHDMIDWLGGQPFEVATPERILRHCRGRGLSLEDLRTCGGRMGCNEYVFSRRP